MRREKDFFADKVATSTSVPKSSPAPLKDKHRFTGICAGKAMCSILTMPVFVLVSMIFYARSCLNNIQTYRCFTGYTVKSSSSFRFDFTEMDYNIVRRFGYCYMP
jgi:hypothetical protein